MSVDIAPLQAVGGAQIPDRLRGLRACLHCKLVKNEESFRESGCDNCTEVYDESEQSILLNTTPIFKGLIAMMNPTESWVARYQRSQVNNKPMVPGLYAIQVTGNLQEAYAAQQQREEEEEEELAEHGEGIVADEEEENIEYE